MTEPLFTIEDLEVVYETPEGMVTAVSNASLEIQEQEFFGLIGESGCGKSTLAKSIIGGLDPNGYVRSGKITYQGEEIQDFSEGELNEKVRWTEISYIPQASMNSLDPIERIDKQAVRIGKAHTDLNRSTLLDRLRELFDVVGIPSDRMSDYPHQFSGGMKQRAIIALSLLLDPKLLIADEPTTALDVIMQDQIFKYLTEVKSEFDTSLLIITHDISVTFEMCENMAIMHAGQVCETGTVEELYDDPKHPYSIALQRSFPNLKNLNQKLETIEGYPPELIGEHAGTYCHFVERCPISTEVCERGEPPLESVDGSDSHRAACFHTDRSAEIARRPPGHADRSVPVGSDHD